MKNDEGKYSSVLSKIPDKELFREAGKRRAAMRDCVGGPKILSPCKWCGVEYGVREMQRHRPECSARKRRAA